MSSHQLYIDRLLSEEYTLINNIKSSEYITIDLFKKNDSDRKIVRLISQNRNDEIFRRILGRDCSFLPKIYDVCAFENGLCVLEEYVSGKTLSEIIKEKPLSEGKALNYFFNVCDAVSFLHSYGIIHRDIKPSNVLITDEDKAVLIDLNSSREYNNESDGDTINLGTPGYAAPEQFGVHQSIPATDIYAMGILLNEMLTGISPVVKTYDGTLGKIIKNCIATQISERYQSVATLKAELEGYKKRHPIRTKK